MTSAAPSAAGSQAPIEGLWCAALTPVTPQGDIDHARFVGHALGLFAQGVDGIAPFGTTGEGVSFSVSARRRGLEALLKGGVAPAQLAPATGCAAFSDAVELTRHALTSGCPRCLVVPPFLYKDVGDEAVFSFYARLIDAVADSRLRLYLYHIPQISGVAIAPSVVARLAKAFPDIVAGVKDSGGDWSHTAALLERARQLAIVVGHEPHLPRLLRHGGSGTICGVANVAAAIVRDLVTAQPAAAAETRIAEFINILFRFPFLPAFKTIKAAQTDDPDWREVCPPLLRLGDSEASNLLAALEAAGFECGPAKR